MRSRSRPQRPRTGSPNAVRSAGTGQKKSTKCRRGGPVAAQRSSGRPRRQGGSPSGADGRGCQAAVGAERSPAPTDDGTREGGPGRTARQALHQAGRERRRGATRRLQRWPPTAEISGTKERQTVNGKAKTCGRKRKHRARISKGGAAPWGRGKGRRRPCPSAEGKMQAA